MKDRNFRGHRAVRAAQGRAEEEDLHRRRQPPRRCRPIAPRTSPSAIRNALKYIAPEQLIVSSDCGFGRQGCNREIAFYKASAIAQGCNIVRRELGAEPAYIPGGRSGAADRHRAQNRTTSSRASLSPCPRAYADANPPFVPEGWRSGACMLGSSADAPRFASPPGHRPGVYRGSRADDDPDPGVTGNGEACQRRDVGGRREDRKPLARGLPLPRGDCQPAGVEAGDDGGRHRRRIGLRRSITGTAGRARREGDRDRARPSARVATWTNVHAPKAFRTSPRASCLPTAPAWMLDRSTPWCSSRHSAASNMQGSC